jgi:hypothetical protein
MYTLLMKQCENTELWGLTELTEKLNESVRSNPYACPDKWFDRLEYYKQLITGTGGAEKMDAELVAHVIATAPNIYNMVTTLLQGLDLNQNDILKITREQ